MFFCIDHSKSRKKNMKSSSKKRLKVFLQPRLFTDILEKEKQNRGKMRTDELASTIPPDWTD